MLNLLRSDFYKLKNSKAFYVAAGFIAIFVTFLIIDFGSSAHIKEQYYPSTFHWIYLPFSENAFLPIFLPFAQGIFITMFITGEYNHRTVREPVALGYSRMKIYLSKWITISVATLIILLLAVILTGISAIFVFDLYGTFTIIDFWQLLRMLFIQVILFLAFASLFQMIAVLLKNMGVVMAVSIFLVILLNSSAMGFINSIVGKALLIMNFAVNAVEEPSVENMVTAIIIGLSYILITNVVGITGFQRQDLK